MRETQEALWQRYRLTLPAYTYVDAARYAGIPTKTVSNWFRGAYSLGHTMHPVFGEVPRDGLSYLQLVEVAFVAEMRRVRRLKLSALRTAYDHVRTELGVEYPFARERFLTDGTDLFIAALDDPEVVVSASVPGQRAWRAAIEACAHSFDYINHLALRWHPMGRDFRIIIDPRISFGRPTIEDTGIPTEAIADRWAAGEEVESLVDDFRLSREQVKDALWFEKKIRRAA
ncbi:MAG: DUF433 domain-containing protein [Chloroflexota bacterium]